MILLQATSVSSGILAGLCCTIFIVLMIIYIPKSNFKIWFSWIFIIGLFYLLVIKNIKYVDNIGNPVTVFLFVCVILLSFYFAYSCFKIYMISKLVIKTKSDIIKRKRIVDRLSFIFALAASLFVVGWEYLALIDANYYVHVSIWVRNTTQVAFFTTMAIILMDGIISKICSPIYTVEIVSSLSQYNLYLRSFNADSTHKKEEKFICRTFNRLFPTYAIGDPNTMLQPYGAERIYATDTEWQEAVLKLMSKAQLIIIRCGLTNGTIWELQQILSSYVAKCVFLVDDERSLTFLRSKLLNMGISDVIPSMDFNHNQYGIYVYRDKTNIWGVLIENITKKSDVESLINGILKINNSVDAEYSKKLDIKHKYLRKLFSSEIPSEVKKSLNWGILSPIINMRHWPGIIWIIFGLSALLCIIFESFIPLYVLFILPSFLLGNRIEWTQNPNSSPTTFLKKQRREASLMWFSMLITGIVSWICVLITFRY